MIEAVAYLQERDHFRQIVEQASDAFFLHDLNGRLIGVNPKACESLGFTRAELLQMTFFDVQQELDEAAMRAAWEKIPLNAAMTLPGRQKRKDGTSFPVETRLSRCEVEGQPLILGLVRDMTERYEAEKALRRSEMKYRSLFDSIDEGFSVIEMVYDDRQLPVDYIFCEVNAAFEKHVGILNATGKTIRELVPAIEQSWVDRYGHVAATGEPVRFVDHSPSLERWFDVYAFRIGEEGKWRVAILFANITERVRAEEALKKSEKLALVGRMAGIISHEINNPLEAVTNLLYLAEADQDPSRVRSYVQMALKEAGRISHIVTHTLRFNRTSLAARKERLATILDSALTLYEGKIKHSGVNLQRKYADYTEVLCFESDLRQVFANLIGNALDATRSGGSVVLRTRDRSNWQTGERGVQVTVADTGCGMSPTTVSRLFEAFYTTKGQMGTGLGLWVSREILTRHHAEVRVKSRESLEKPERYRRNQPVSGTVFSLWFPVERADLNDHA